MRLDIRLPVGLFFLVSGLLLVGYGFFVDPEVYARHSLGQNVNSIWGLIFAAFGLLMLWLVRRTRTRATRHSRKDPS